MLAKSPWKYARFARPLKALAPRDGDNVGAISTARSSHRRPSARNPRFTQNHQSAVAKSNALSRCSGDSADDIHQSSAERRLSYSR